jgi:hypothetical protein
LNLALFKSEQSGMWSSVASWAIRNFVIVSSLAVAAVFLALSARQFLRLRRLSGKVAPAACPKCHYPLADAPRLLCTECGYSAETPRLFLKPARRRVFWRGSLLLAVAVIIAFVPSAVRTDWVSWMPRDVMFAAIRLAPGKSTWAVEELHDRFLKTQKLSASDEAWYRDFIVHMIREDISWPTGKFGRWMRGADGWALDRTTSSVQTRAELMVPLILNSPSNSTRSRALRVLTEDLLRAPLPDPDQEPNPALR